MSKSMGIKINIDYSDVNDLKAALAKKIPVELEDSSIKNTIKGIKTSLEGLKSSSKINLKFDTTKAMTELNEFKTAYTNLKNEVESGMSFKLDFSKAFTENGAINIKDNLEKAGFSVDKVQREVDNIVGSLDKYQGSTFDKLKISEKINSEGGKDYYRVLSESLDDYTKKQTKYINGSVAEQSVTENRLKALQDIADVTKEVYKLEEKLLSADQFDRGAISAQIEKTKGHLKELKDSWTEVTGMDANDSTLVKISESTGEYSLKIKEAAIARQEQNNIEKETAAQLKEVIALENEKHSVTMKAQKAGGSSEKQVLNDRAEAITTEISGLKEKYNLEAKLTQQQKDQLVSVQQANNVKQEFAQAQARSKSEDKAAALAQKAIAEEQIQTYKMLEASIKEYATAREKMSDLEAKQDAGSITAQEESKLQIMQKRLALTDEITAASIKEHAEQGKLTQAQSESLQALQQTRNERLKNVQTISKEKAELQKIDAEYDKLKASMKQVSDLEVKKASAGKDEAAVIDEIIAKERERQSVIRETINLSGQKNAAAERELDTLEESLEVQKREKIAQSQARSNDASRGVSSTDALLGMVSVRSIYNEGKQAFQYLYRNIKELDDAMVDVKKVANATDAEFANFEKTIFNHASAVGKTASEYATSVERWAASGYDLSEAIKYAEYSSMGAFVGNIDEAKMVDYMSVPMISFKNDGLEPWEVLNVMNEVANNNAVEMDHLGQAYARASATAAQSGTTFSELTAILGTAQETTRLGGEVIGTTWRTMDKNVAQIASRSTKGQQKMFDAFESIGVSVLDANGGLASTYDVLADLQDAWGDLDDIQRTTFASNIGGARGLPIVQALMANWDTVDEIRAQAETQLGMPEGVGSAYDEFAEQQNSLAFKQAELQNSWAELLHTVTGGKSVFMSVMDIGIQAIEKLNEWAQNDAIVDGVTAAAKGFGTLIGMIVSVQSYMFASRMIGDVANAFLNLGEAGKRMGNLKSILSGGGGLKATFGALVSPFGKFAIVAAGVTAGLWALNKVLDHFGYDLWGRFSTGFSDSAYEIKEFGKRQEELLDTLGESQNIYQAIDQADELAKSYANLLSEKEAAAAASGDYTMLQLDEEEYNTFMTQHNNLVDELGLEKDLKITFNNADHILGKMMDLNGQLDELEMKRMKLDAIALSEGMGGIDSRILRDDYLGNYTGDFDTTVTRIVNTMDALNEARRDPTNNAEYIKMLEDDLRTLRLSNEYKQGLKEHFSDEQKDWNESREQFDKFYQDYIGRINSQDDPVKTLMEVLTQPEIRDMPGMYLRIMDSIAQTIKQTEQFGEVQSALNDTFKEFGYNNKSEDAVSSINDIELQYGQLLATSEALNSWYEANGMEPSKGLRNLLEADEAVVQEFINTVLPNAIKEMESESQELEAAVVGMAENFGISADKARELIGKSKTDRGGFIRDLFGLTDSGEISNAEVAEAIGLNNIQLLLAENMVDGVDQSVGSLMQNIHNSISSMEGEDLELALKLGIVNDAGEVDYNQVIEELSGFDKQFLVEIGVVAQDGTVDDIDNLYQALGMIDEGTAAEIGVAFNGSTAMVDFENLKEQMANGEVVIEPTIDPTTGEVLSMEISKVVDGEKQTTITVDADTAPARDAVRKVQTEAFKDKMTIYVNVEPTYDEGDQEKTENYLKNYLLGGVNAGKINVEAIPNLIIDGEINEEAIAEALHITEEVEKDIRLKLSLSEDEPLNLSDITWYIDEIGKTKFGDDHSSDGFVEFVMTLFPSLKFEEPEVDVEAELEEMLGLDEEIEEDIVVTLKPKIGEGASSSTSAAGGGTIVPDKLETVWNIIQTGEVTPETINALVNDMPESIQTQYGINIGDSAQTIDQINNILSGMDREQQVDFLVNTVGIDDVNVVQELLNRAEGDVQSNINLGVDGVAEAQQASQELDEVDGREVSASVGANKFGFDIVMALVDASLALYRKTTVFIHGNADNYNRVIDNLKTRSVMIDVKGNVSSSRAIGQQLGSSFSASVGSQVFGRSASSGVGRSASTETKISEDVWRYWSKELFTGLPIEKSLEDLSNELKKNADNQGELVKLYRQQITLIDRQIAHERDMQKAQQEELTSILSKLQSEGFTASGNRITNLDRAKSFSGDKASEVEGLLNEWKKLYESLDSIDKNIAKLDLDKYNAKEDIRQAEIKKELERIEERMKASEALLRSVSNNTSIQNTKEDLIGSQDYELELSVKEQGMNTASASIEALLKNYNQLATTIVEYEENAEELQGTMESLRDSILENADAVIEYREEMNRIQLDRMIGDFGSFNAMMNRNAESLTNNIEKMKEGLLSGQSLSDLESFGTLDINRKTKLERDYELRLQLEADLNKSLEEYAAKNIERTKSVADAVLKVEANKYNQLLEMSKSFTNGQAVEAFDFNNIGLTSASPSEKSGLYEQWKSQLEVLTEAYSDEYLTLVREHEKAIDGATSSIDKQALSQKAILDQLSLQEKLYRDMISYNNLFISQAEAELENASLTTDQRNQLIDAIEEYKLANTEAQQAIKDTVASRFDYEFSLLDKAAKKAESYVTSLEHMLNVAELINMDSSQVAEIYEAVYASKVNQYSAAKNELEDLMKQQAKFEEGSFEWNLLNERIEEVSSSLKDFGVNALNANHDVLNNALDSIQDKFERGILNDKTLEEWKEYNENWLTGLQKQLSLEDLRMKSLNIEDDLIKGRLEMLDRQEKVSQKDVDYLDKQIKVMELQGKLDNISQERNVQTLVRDADGRWGLGYDFDQTEYDKTQKELRDAQKELDKYLNDQRQGYADSLGTIIGRAGEGSYGSTAELESALDNLKDVYGMILGDIPDLEDLSYDELLGAYEKYLLTNSLLSNDMFNSTNTLGTADVIKSIGTQFESSFMKISTDFGQVIGNEVREVLRDLLSQQSDNGGGENNYYINSIEFPNVETASEIQKAFDGLRDAANQRVNKKD